MSGFDGNWIAWSIDGRSGAKLCLGQVFLGELSYPHDFGLGARWKAWLNQQHLGFFRTEEEARRKIEAEILNRWRSLQPAWAAFQERMQEECEPAPLSLSKSGSGKIVALRSSRRAARG